jgi:hypothetical membrane protein
MGALSAIVAPVLAFSCIFLAIYSYPTFSWTNNALSDLGVVPGITGPVFNFGLCAGGFFVFNSAIFGLFNYLRQSWVGKIGALAFAAVGLSLMGIGFFPENMIPAHFLFSVAFFVLIPISLLIITVAFAVIRRWKLATFTLLIAVAAALPWVFYFYLHYVHGVAIPEFLSAIAGSIWSVVQSYKMYKAAS